MKIVTKRRSIIFVALVPTAAMAVSLFPPMKSTPRATPSVVASPTATLPPPVENWGIGFHADVPVLNPTGGQVRADLSWDTRGQSVVLNWTHAGQGLTHEQVVKLSYWPTFICAVDGAETFAVAGKRRTGNTTIEAFEIHEPSLINAILPDGSSAPVSIAPTPVVSVNAVYDKAEPNLDIIDVMVLMRGSEDALLVQFAAGDVYSVELSTINEVEHVASPIATPGALLAPSLTVHSHTMRVANHVSHGLIYHLAASSGEASTVFRGLDRDDVIDDVIEMSITNDLWTSMGFSDPDNYLPL